MEHRVDCLHFIDKLPVCALVDDAIFCAHGGIPFTAKTIEEIVAVKRDIREPQPESDIAWEILWSDPVGMQEFLYTCEVRGVDPDTTNGFVFNTKRGKAYKFNEQGEHLRVMDKLQLVSDQLLLMSRCEQLPPSEHVDAHHPCARGGTAWLRVPLHQQVRHGKIAIEIMTTFKFNGLKFKLN